MRNNWLTIIVVLVSSVALQAAPATAPTTGPATQPASSTDRAQRCVDDYNAAVTAAHDQYIQDLRELRRRQMKIGNLEQANQAQAAIEAADRELVSKLLPPGAVDAARSDAMTNAPAPALARADDSDTVTVDVIRKMGVESGGHHILIVFTPMGFAHAKNVCEKLGGHLAIVNTREKIALVQQLAHEHPVWVGGYNITNRWTWFDNKTIEEALWPYNEPASVPNASSVMVTRLGIAASAEIQPEICGFACEFDR